MMILSNPYKLLALVAACLWTAVAQAEDAPVRLLDRDVHEFAPARGESIAIPFELDEQASVVVEILSPDGEVLRRLAPQDLDAGRHEVPWDGKDNAGDIVPDEAYTPRLVVRSQSDEVYRVDPRQGSGGETLQDLEVSVVDSGDIRYVLPRPARVLIRAGIAGGSMVKSFSTLSPRPAGANVQRWDGYDESEIERVLDRDDVRVLVTAFALPEHSLIAHGNDAYSYHEYREMKGWPRPESDSEAAPLKRDGQRIARQHYAPASSYRDPEIALELVDTPKDDEGVYLVDGPVHVRVEVADEDKWLLEESLFEVAFFLDHRFVAEEEHGYLPLTWRWRPDPGKPGQRVLTVNVISFDGPVGVASVPVRVLEIE